MEGHFIAVGPEGSVYVGQRNRVQRFAANGTYLGQFALWPRPVREGGEAGGVAELLVDPAGNLYVVRVGVDGVNEYDPTGQLIRTYDEQEVPDNAEGPSSTIALDPQGELYVNELSSQQHRIQQYSPAGIALATLDEGQEDALHGIAYNDLTGQLFMLNTNGNTTPPIAHVRTLTPPPPPPFAPEADQPSLLEAYP